MLRSMTPHLPPPIITSPQLSTKREPALAPPPQFPSKPAALAASVAVLLRCSPVDAGVLSGFPGIESAPGPELPQVEFLSKWNAENQKKYAELDSKFRSSPVLKELLEKTKANKEKNRRALEDKYCMRGAEWGIGDCSTTGMTQAEREEFISMLKKKVSGGE